MKEKSMSKTIEPKVIEDNIDDLEDELRPEYDIKALLKNSVRGKYADRFTADARMILLAPDVADYFRTEDAVNEALRLVIRLSQIAKAS